MVWQVGGQLTPLSHFFELPSQTRWLTCTLPLVWYVSQFRLTLALDVKELLTVVFSLLRMRSGCTPVVALGRSVPDAVATVVGKLESLNPNSSVKDRLLPVLVEQLRRRECKSCEN